MYIRERNSNATSSEEALLFNKVLTESSGITKNSDAHVNSLAVGDVPNVVDSNMGVLAVGEANILTAEKCAAIGNYNVVKNPYAVAVGDKAVIEENSGIIFAVGTGRTSSGGNR